MESITGIILAGTVHRHRPVSLYPNGVGGIDRLSFYLSLFIVFIL